MNTVATEVFAASFSGPCCRLSRSASRRSSTRHIRVQHHDVVLKHYPTCHATLWRPLSATIVFIPYTAVLDIRLSIDRSILQPFRRRLVRHALLMVGSTKCNKDWTEGFLDIRLQRTHFFLSTATNHALWLVETKILGKKSTWQPCEICLRSHLCVEEAEVVQSIMCVLLLLQMYCLLKKWFQDLGNTNYSIHLPRHSFDRSVTAQIILRAVRSLGVNAHVNDRNDICIEDKKICVQLSHSHQRSLILFSVWSTFRAQPTKSWKIALITMGLCSYLLSLRRWVNFYGQEKWVRPLLLGVQF